MGVGGRGGMGRKALSQLLGKSIFDVERLRRQRGSVGEGESVC